VILNYLALFGGPDVLRCDAQRLVDFLWRRCQRLNATYTHIILRAADPRGPCFGCRLG